MADKSNIILTLPVDEIVVTGKQVTFVAPCSSSEFDKLIIAGEEFIIVDSLGVRISDNAFIKGALVSVLLNAETHQAIIQNAGSNKSLEDSIKSLEEELKRLEGIIGDGDVNLDEITEEVENIKQELSKKTGYKAYVQVFDPRDDEKHEGFAEEDYTISSEIHNDYINNEANIKGAFVTGRNNKARREYSCMSGTHNISEGYIAHVEGANNLALGGICHVEGRRTTASGEVSHIEGESFNKIRDIIPDFSKSTPIADIIEAWGTETTKFSLAYGNYSHVEGKDCLAFGEGSHAGGQFSIAKANYSFAHGHSVTASGLYSSAMGNATTASNTGAFAIGHGSVASGLYSLATGFESKATANYASSFGYKAEANGDISFAVGYETKANGKGSFVAGYKSESSGEYSFALGYMSKALANYAVALGHNTTAKGIGALSSGYYSSAPKDYTHAMGYYASTGWEVGQMAVGRFNSTLSGAMFIVGNGVDNANRSNAFVVFRNGTATLQEQGTEENSVVIKKTLKEIPAADILFDGSEEYIGGTTVDEALRSASSEIISLCSGKADWGTAQRAVETAEEAKGAAEQAQSDVSALSSQMRDLDSRISSFEDNGAREITYVNTSKEPHYDFTNVWEALDYCLSEIYKLQK